MLRTLVLAAWALFVCAPQPLTAQTADWVKIATAEIDVRAAGRQSIDLSKATGSFRALRLQSDLPVTLTRVETIDQSRERATENAVRAKTGVPTAPIFLAPAARFLDVVEIAWDADPKAAGPVKIEVWGQQTATEAAAVRSTGGKTRSIVTPKKAPEPTYEAAPPPPPAAATRSARPEPAPSPAPAGAAAPAAKPSNAPNVCLDTNVCTIVNVFYGTDRKPVKHPDRVNYGGDRDQNLTLGHAFVTVPKAQRVKGTITRPSLLDIYLRGMPAEGDPAKHFTIPKGGVTVYATEADFLLAARQHIANAGDFKNHAFIYVHGYAVTFENAVYRAAQISYDLSPDGRPFGTAFVFTWPSAGKADPFSYNYDQESADFAVSHLREYIKLVSDKTGVENVHIIAHSMGNRVLMRALEQVALTGTKARLNQIVLAAPDVDKQQFETVIAGVGQIAKGITLYASGSDNALMLSREARGGGGPRAGEIRPPAGPALVKGVDTIDISALSTSIFSWGHDTYAESKELLDDISRILTTGVRPPTARNGKFEILKQGSFQYWRYAADKR